MSVVPAAFKEELCLVTGVSGFVGLHVARAASEAGLRVRGSVRSAAKHREAIEKVVPGIELVELDLVTATAAEWEAALAGCTFCCHVASPFPILKPKDEDELIVPAVEGTKKVVSACKAAGVRRVVVTSSVAAVQGGLNKSSYSSSDWSDVEKCDPYPKSKTLAERAARALAEELGLEIATINPSYIQGPVLQARECSSTKLGTRLLTGDMPAVPAIGMNIADVRDVADAHIAALRASSSGGRYIVDGGATLMTDVAVAVKKAHPEYPVKTFGAPWFLLKLFSFFDQEVAGVLGRWKKLEKYDTSPVEELLGRKLRGPEESVLAMTASLDEFGLAGSKKKG